MNIVFMGTPNFAADVLKVLINDDNIEISAVYTAPDAVRARGRKLIASPVKKIALDANIDVVSPLNFKSEKDINLLRSYNPQFICVAAYGLLLPVDVLNIAQYECLNIHGSLLPKWRGAAPIQRSILACDKKIGISIMRMDKGMDTGAYCMQYSTDINGFYFNDLEKQLAYEGAKCLINSMKNIINNNVNWIKQDLNQVSYASKLEKSELWLFPEDTVNFASRKIQASNDAHPCKCTIANKGVTILKSCLTTENIDIPKSKFAFVNKKLYLGFSDGVLEILELKPDGKNIMEAKAFAAGIQNIKDNLLEWGSYGK